MTAPLPAAVLWDMDGTIVDTEPYWMSVQGEMVKSHGGVWTAEAAKTLIGQGMDHSARLLQEFGVDLPQEEIIQAATDGVIDHIRSEVPWRPGAVELLRELRDRGVRTALVTMSIGRMAREVADSIPFEAFDLVVSGDEVEHSKPHPEPYLAAARALGVDAADCVAIEDSVAGVTSAVAAGAATVGVQHMLNLDDTGATAIWTTLAGRTVDDLADVLAEHRAARGADPRTRADAPTPIVEETP
ncbi:HAD family phosphatase [Cnuibacter physcomitrellae]|uniref:HAD family hydrolase n=1 Tax=Cnuibacter physcomitrellae TaxID=1619308 RepID=UPI002175C0B1|nr:HAD family phosphatase [Cnuibacter physcomitrellae]MCS5497000.1 HAD family phosphatase [Cnuibacter physcomitrellae]